MAHYAQIDNDVVVNVIVADEEFIRTLPGEWIQTSYNTWGGVHHGSDGKPDGGVALRKNFAGIGDTYDRQRDAFIKQPRFNGWVLDEDTCQWVPPVPLPPQDGNIYIWDNERLEFKNLGAPLRSDGSVIPNPADSQGGA